MNNQAIFMIFIKNHEKISECSHVAWEDVKRDNCVGLTVIAWQQVGQLNTTESVRSK